MTNLLNKRVQIIHSRKPTYNKTLNQFGIVKNDSCNSEIGILIDGLINPASNKGLFWFKRTEIKIINNMEENGMAKLEGYKFVAVIENGGMGYDQKDYFYALYDENIKAGDTVVVTGTANGQLLKVKDVLSIKAAEEIAPKNIIAEVIGRIDTSSYDKRVEDRKVADQIRKQLLEKRKEIEARKDDEHYASLDPDYAELLKTLHKLSV